jgi:hypothetical protein
LLAYLSRRDGRKDRVMLHFPEVVGHPVNEFMPIAAEGLGIHGMLLSS